MVYTFVGTPLGNISSEFGMYFSGLCLLMREGRQKEKGKERGAVSCGEESALTLGYHPPRASRTSGLLPKSSPFSSLSLSMLPDSEPGLTVHRTG